MSFQKSLDKIEAKTELTPRQIIEIASTMGLDAPEVDESAILEWLKTDFDLSRRHGMALVHVIKGGPEVDAAHVGTDGVQGNGSEVVWLDGKITRP